MKMLFFYGYSFKMNKDKIKELPFSALYYIMTLFLFISITLLTVFSVILEEKLLKSFYSAYIIIFIIVFAFIIYYYDKNEIYKDFIKDFERLPKSKQEQYMIRSFIILVVSFISMFGSFILLDYKFHH